MKTPDNMAPPEVSRTPDGVEPDEVVKTPEHKNPPNQQQYDEAKRKANHRLAQMNASTVATYKSVIRRLLTRDNPESPRTKTSARVQRAAIQRFQLVGLVRCKTLPQFLRACTSFGWSANEIVQSVLTEQWSYSHTPQIADAMLSANRRRKTKRKLLALLQTDWRQQFIAGIKSQIPAMREAFVLLAITGCRPCEIPAASISQNAEGNVVIRIVSAKRRIHQLGDWREIRQPLPKIYGDCRGLLDPSIHAQLRKITPKQIADVARKVSRRVFPSLGEQITASAFRHQFCSDLKSQGVSKREIALALGHSLIESQSGYGRPRYGFAGQVKFEIHGSCEPSEPNSDLSITFLDISSGNDLPEP